MDVDEEVEDDQKEFLDQPQKKPAEGNVAKQSSGDSSFKENPYTYLSVDDPALISCLYCLALLHSSVSESYPFLANACI
jgi:hypothetical protein